MLTVSVLDELNPGIFAYGVRVIEVRYDGSLFWEKWVATRGQIHDWAIYHIIKQIDKYYSLDDFDNEWPIERVASYGDKVYGDSTIKELVPCDEEAFKLYRY